MNPLNSSELKKDRPRSNGKYVEMDLRERLESKIDKSGDCWVWIGSRNEKGYGNVWYKGTVKKAHRIYYELVVGKVPETLDLDHKCFVRACVNPDHLEPVSRSENVKRGMARYFALKPKTGG